VANVQRFDHLLAEHGVILDALIFDFDGVVVDSEPVHFRAFREVLGRRGIGLTSEQYYSLYLGFDDHDCFGAVLRANGRAVEESLIAAMMAEKTAMVQQAFGRSIKPLPGAVELMRAARAAGVPLAICSGALRQEILLAAKTVGALELVKLIVSAEDVAHGKPDPEGYVMAIRQLGEALGRPIDPARTWVVEDSPAGIDAAKAAGCRVLAVTNSYNADALTRADRIVTSLQQVSLAELVA
jgi:beta-phosphoglucomutase